MRENKSAGTVILGAFFALATAILVAVGVALLFPGSMMDGIWSLYPARRGLLIPYHAWLGPAFLVLALAMAAASVGCFRRRRWGWRLAIAIFAINGLGDVMQLLTGRILEGATGVAAAGAILFYLYRPKVRDAFA
jgi:hypothetical protein